MIDLTPVTSSNIAGVGYDAATGALTVQFHSGAIWQYSDVPPKTYAELMTGEGIGARFAADIRAQYPGVRVA